MITLKILFLEGKNYTTSIVFRPSRVACPVQGSDFDRVTKSSGLI